MPDHIVQQGECLSSIADAYKLPRQAIWNHARNSDLRQKRTNPDTLYPEDVLFVPDKDLREENCVTEWRHLFVRRRPTVQFRLRLLRNDEPRAGEPYTLDVGGESVSGRTDDEGWLSHRIPATATQGTLALKDGAEQYSLQLGSMDPIEEISGVQGRLKNLGFFDGDINGQWGDQTEEALRSFQQKRHMSPTGRLDEATVASLKEEYGH